MFDINSPVLVILVWDCTSNTSKRLYSYSLSICPMIKRSIVTFRSANIYVHRCRRTSKWHADSSPLVTAGHVLVTTPKSYFSGSNIPLPLNLLCGRDHF